MLEHSTLLIHEWAQTEGRLGWTRRITDNAGQPLGLVRYTGDTRDTWFSWLRRRRLEVDEAPDASHLMTLTRRWSIFRAWDVHDAENRHVGCVHAKSIVTSDNQCAGYFDLRQGQVVDPSGQVLARFAPGNGGGLELTFASHAPKNPFLRMLLVGCALSLDPAPRR